jgi:hypothetical protein
MDQIAEMQEEAGKKIDAKKDELLDAFKSKISKLDESSQVMQYSDDMADMLKNRP